MTTATPSTKTEPPQDVHVNVNTSATTTRTNVGSHSRNVGVLIGFLVLQSALQVETFVLRENGTSLCYWLQLLLCGVLAALLTICLPHLLWAVLLTIDSQSSSNNSLAQDLYQQASASFLTGFYIGAALLAILISRFVMMAIHMTIVGPLWQPIALSGIFVAALFHIAETPTNRSLRTDSLFLGFGMGSLVVGNLFGGLYVALIGLQVLEASDEMVASLSYPWSLVSLVLIVLALFLVQSITRGITAMGSKRKRLLRYLQQTLTGGLAFGGVWSWWSVMEGWGLVQCTVMLASCFFLLATKPNPEYETVVHDSDPVVVGMDSSNSSRGAVDARPLLAATIV